MNKHKLTIVALSLGMLCACGSAVAQSSDERLNRLESQVQKLSQENADLKKQLGLTDTKTTPSLVRPGGNTSNLSVGGFLMGQAEFGNAPDSRFAGMDDRFFFRRARINVAGNFDPVPWDFKTEIDMQGNTLGASTGNTSRANEIFINWHQYSFANLRFGQLKPAFGYEQLTSDTKTPTIERFLANDRLIDGRNLAVGAAGTFANSKFTYYTVLAMGNGSNVSKNDNNKFQPSLRVTMAPYTGKLGDMNSKLTLGANILSDENTGLSRSDLGLTGNSFTGKRDMYGVDAQWTLGDFYLGGEYIECKFRPENNVPFDSFRAKGWHGTLGYFVIPGKVQTIVRREQFDGNKAIGGNTFKEWVFGINYYIKSYDVELQANYIIGDGPGDTYDKGRLLTRVQVCY